MISHSCQMDGQRQPHAAACGCEQLCELRSFSYGQLSNAESSCASMAANVCSNNAVCFAAIACPDALFGAGEIMRRQPRYQTTNFIAWLALQCQPRGKTNGATTTVAFKFASTAPINKGSVVVAAVICPCPPKRMAWSCRWTGTL